MENDNSTVGYVYVVEMEGQGIFKIGKTVDVSRRMGQFGIQPPFPYRLLFARRVHNMHLGETCLHKIYSPHRLNGEWFRLSPSQIATINHHLLTWQAENLIERIASMVHDVCHDASPDHLRRLMGILIAVKRRADRRFETYYTLKQSQSLASPQGATSVSSQSELLN